MNKLTSLMLVLLWVFTCISAAIAEENWVKTPGEISAWDREVDFLIVGFGLAGAAAVVEAHDIDPEARILVLEKMPHELVAATPSLPVRLIRIEVLSGDMDVTPEQLTAYITHIVNAQSIGVDVIAGATVDCQAIGAALGEAFLQ